MTSAVVCNRCCLTCTPWRTDSLDLWFLSAQSPTAIKSYSAIFCRTFTQFVAGRIDCGDLQPRSLLKGETGLEKLTGRSWAGSNKIRGNLGKELPPVCGGGDENGGRHGGEDGDALFLDQTSNTPGPVPCLTFHRLPCSVSFACALSWSQIALMSMWRNGWIHQARHQSVSAVQ